MTKYGQNAILALMLFSAQLRALAQLNLCYWVLSGVRLFVRSSVKQGHVSLLLDQETFGHASRWPMALAQWSHKFKSI